MPASVLRAQHWLVYNNPGDETPFVHLVKILTSFQRRFSKHKQQYKSKRKPYIHNY
jgi:hypothetical protein